MVAKRELKFIKSLHQKKQRSLSGFFLAEGVKVVETLMDAGWKPTHLYSTSRMGQFPSAQPISEKELKSVSTLKQPNQVLGVFEIPAERPPEYQGWILALDRLRDPGNLGTIIRLCDWFGIREILCSPDSVDCFNPKVVMASMGSLARVQVHYLPLGLAFAESGLPVFGADMDGVSASTFSFPKEGILLMGSESHGINPDLKDNLKEALNIRPFANPGAESLNVGVATGILMYELRKQQPFTQR
ncbi:RNA methyltransferase [Robiginitalea sp.]|uniref:RNA methyltransferase n=1 Tax=Robiginitalea sp. TaxID=1902411 RepID=UPI003C54DB27